MTKPAGQERLSTDLGEGNRVDFDDPNWAAIRAFFETKKLDLMKQLAQPTIENRTADQVRGGIRLCDAVLELDAERPYIPSDIYK